MAAHLHGGRKATGRLALLTIREPRCKEPTLVQWRRLARLDEVCLLRTRHGRGIFVLIIEQDAVDAEGHADFCITTSSQPSICLGITIVHNIYRVGAFFVAALSFRFLIH